mgnify:CR=1 FL=1
MMSVKEYALDINVTVEAVIKKAQELGYDIKNADDMLDEDQIIDLDNTLTMNVNEEEEPEYIDEITEEKDYDLDAELEDKAEELASASHIRFDDTVKKQKLKKKSEVQKEDMHAKRKQMYKNKEKLMQNEASHDDNIIVYKEGMTVSELAKELNVNPTEVIKKLMNLGIMASLNNSLSYDDVEMIVIDYDKTLKSFESQDKTNFEKFEVNDDPASLVDRPAVVTIMGHVDHGKTSLLDYIRNSHITTGEFGGITQHIGAYQIEKNGKKITFIDTPGHEAFTAMRARGASVTDIVIIIVSAVDGIKPQTVEAIDHAKAANVPIIVAINKMDLPGANPERVLQALTEYGLTPEDWGGDTLVNKISAKTKEGIDELLDNILLIAELKNLRANKNRYATGTVIEARLDKNIGAVCSILIQNGTLRLGDPIVVGNFHGKVRTLKNDRGENILSATPSTPVEITGLNDLPVSGDKFMAFETEKEARKVSEERTLRHKEANTNRNGMTLDDLFSKVKDGTKKINIVLKTDVKGSEEAIKASLQKLNIEGVSIDVIRSGVGTITESDIVLASASNALIYGFNVRPNNKTMEVAKQYGVEIRLHNIIYKMLEELEQAIKGMLDPEYEEKVTGEIEVRQIFKFSKVGVIAGSHVTDGVIKANSKARLIRDGIVIYDGKIASLQREKDKVNEVKKGMDCGVTLENFMDIKENDIIETYEMVEIKRWV